MSAGWSFYVIALTVIMIVGVTWVLFANRTRPSADDETTGHVHDGIEEYDNPLPAWWFYLFVITIVYSIGYLIMFPGMGNFPGLLNWTSIDRWEKQNERAQEKYAEVFARYREVPVDELYLEPKAMRMAQRIFANNCAQCHGMDARGTTGYPDLTDHDWLYGGSAAQIEHSIRLGRTGAMPPWEMALGEQGVEDVAKYVVSMAEGDSDALAANEAGQKGYSTFCVACHGADGKGNMALGSPDLTDSTWLYGGTLSAIKHSIAKGRTGVMPAHEDSINPDKIHLLSGYVYGLSRREPST